MSTLDHDRIKFTGKAPFKIQVLSMKEMIQLEPVPNSAVISINDPAEFGRNMTSLLPLLHDSNVIEILPLVFDDITENDYEVIAERIPSYVLRLFSDIQAVTILEWVAAVEIKKIDTLYIYCQAGISRSAAVASAILHTYVDSKYLEYWNSPIHYPNSYIFKVLLNSFGTRISDENLNKLKDMSTIALKSPYQHYFTK